jgi:hypothetical protein
MYKLNVRVLVVGAIFLATACSAQAQIVPYETRGQGAQFDTATGMYWGTGNGTLMGRHSFAGSIIPTDLSNPLVVPFQSVVPQETVAANGDKLYFDVVGVVHYIPLEPTFTYWTAVWEAEFTVVGGTGRFRNAQPADQPLTTVAVNDPFTLTDPVLTFSWTVSGHIRLK